MLKIRTGLAALRFYRSGTSILIKANKYKLSLGYLYGFIALLVFNPDFYTDTHGGSADLKDLGVATDDGANMHSG